MVRKRFVVVQVRKLTLKVPWIRSQKNDLSKVLLRGSIKVFVMSMEHLNASRIQLTTLHSQMVRS